MTCPHCGLDVDNGQPMTADRSAHAYCANVAKAQALRPWLTSCYKHHVELVAGWCPTCREVVRAH